jgi:hypothetical protein
LNKFITNVQALLYLAKYPREVAGVGINQTPLASTIYARKPSFHDHISGISVLTWNFDSLSGSDLIFDPRHEFVELQQ